MRRSFGSFSRAVTSGPKFFGVSSFSTSSAGGGGRGRGRGLGSDFPNFGFIPGEPESLVSNVAEVETSEETPVISNTSGFGRGRGRGKPLPSQPPLPGRPTFVDGAFAGRGRGVPGNVPFQRLEEHPPSQEGPSRKHVFAREADTNRSAIKPQVSADSSETRLEDSNPPTFSSVFSGAGRGKTSESTSTNHDKKVENRHIRPREARGTDKSLDTRTTTVSSSGPKLSREEAIKKAIGILSRGDNDRPSGRGRGAESRGSGRRGRIGRKGGLDEESGGSRGLFVDENDNSGERLAAKFGADFMNQLEEGFEEMSGEVLPSPADSAYLDALHTNMLIECEPEYRMEEFGTNPDLDEKPPIPLRDALEKMKPFLVAYEGIQSQEEWEEVMKETMDAVPLLQKIVDYYGGPDRVTAKQQQEELERVGKTLPESAPDSVQRFTDRALLSLQSNPGWGFDKKCQFMDKLVWEVSQHYK